MAGDIALDLSWPAFENIVRTIAKSTVDGGRPDVIVGITRGGLIPAVMLSHETTVREFDVLDIRRTLRDEVNAAKAEMPQMRSSVRTDLRGLDVVLVDDVAGSGKTAMTAISQLHQAGAKRVRSAVCVVNINNWDAETAGSPDETFDYVGTTCKGWVQFPWERN